MEETDIDQSKVAGPAERSHNQLMYARAVPYRAPAASAVAALYVNELDCDVQGISIPRVETHLVVRFGPFAQGGLDVHAMGGRSRVRRKQLRKGQRVVTARLHLATAQAVLGVPPSAIAGSVVPIQELWGGASARSLCDRLAAAHSTFEAADVLASTIAERVALAGAQLSRTQLALAAAARLTSANVNAVANDLGVSERHLRRVFRETIGVSPKTFAQLARFRQALRAARDESHTGWANIAVAAGYYDQAHLITEFRTIAGVTPRALLGELRVARSIG